MLDAITSLAFSMHSNPGVYALLLGSGVSRSANIPTGWDITLDLVRKIATSQGVPQLPVGAAEAWYREKFDETPDYAQLLDGLAKSQSERQQVLKSYIEPTEAEREQGHKLPTPAHRAIAQLVAAGKVRVIITTNFDQLLEAALRDEGVVPTVVDSADAAHGAVPLVHSPCTVIKIHGDYMDTRIRNTPGELEHYDLALDQLLDRVFDEFGLIVCGWSADWDVALKAAISRTPTRRYSMYWAARGTPSAAAQALISQRGMSQIAIEGADAFFTALEASVAALDEFNAPHPISTEIAVTQLKKYLAEDRHRIALDDLIRNELKQLQKGLDEVALHPHRRGSPELMESLTTGYESLANTLVTLAMVAGQWASDDQMAPWLDVLKSLGDRAVGRTGGLFEIELQRWPAALLMHAFGLGALAQGREGILERLMDTQIGSNSRKAWYVGDRLNAGSFFDNGQDRGKEWSRYQEHSHPVTSRLYDVLLPIGERVLGAKARFDRAFVGMEMVLVFGYAERQMKRPTPEEPHPSFWAPQGRYCLQDKLRSEWLERWKLHPELLKSAARLKLAPRTAEVEAEAKRVASFF